MIWSLVFGPKVWDPNLDFEVQTYSLHVEPGSRAWTWSLNWNLDLKSRSGDWTWSQDLEPGPRAWNSDWGVMT